MHQHAWLMFAITLAACDNPYERKQSVPCGPGLTRSYEIWCTDAGDCEYRIAQSRFACPAGDIAACTEAAMNVQTACSMQ